MSPAASVSACVRTNWDATLTGRRSLQLLCASDSSTTIRGTHRGTHYGHIECRHLCRCVPPPCDAGASQSCAYPPSRRSGGRGPAQRPAEPDGTATGPNRFGSLRASSPRRLRLPSRTGRPSRPGERKRPVQKSSAAGAPRKERRRP